MALSNLRVVNDQQAIQSRAQAAIESYKAKSNEQAGSQQISIRKGRRLDVDDVLARSLPSLTIKGLGSGKEKIFGRT
jgi:hypothetical protein